MIHLAYNHDFVDMAAAARTDLRAVDAIGAAIVGSAKPFVVTSGTLGLALGGVVPPGGIGTEEDVPDPALPRVASEDAAITLARQGVRSSVVRLAPSVHGDGDHGFVPRLIDIARDRGVSAYVGDGGNRWPAVHRLDAARLFRLAVEAAPAGSRLHGVGDEGVPFRDIAGIIGRRLDVPVTSISSEEADAALRLPRDARVGRQPHIERADAGAPGVASGAPRSDPGPRRGSLLRVRGVTTTHGPGPPRGPQYPRSPRT